jgi:hypothetical protein
MNINDIKNEEQYIQFYRKIQSPQVDGAKKYMGVMFPKDYRAFLDLISSYEKGKAVKQEVKTDDEVFEDVPENKENEETPIDADTEEDTTENSKILKKKKR